MATARRSSPLVLLGWSATLVAVVGVLLRLDDRTGGQPALSSPTDARVWLDQLDPALVGFTLVRFIALACASYLLVTTIVAVVTRLSRRDALVRVTDRFTVPAIRHLVGRSLGLGLTASVVVSVGPALARSTPGAPESTEGPPTTSPSTGAASPGQPATSGAALPGQPATMVVIDDEAPVDRPAGDDRRSTATQRRLGDDHPAAPSITSTTTTTTSAAPRPPAPGLAPGEVSPPGRADGQLPEPGARPGEPTPATSEPSATGETWTIAPGDHLWGVAAATLDDHDGGRPADHRIARYLDLVIDANRWRLADPDNPDLVYPGQVMVLPPVPQD